MPDNSHWSATGLTVSGVAKAGHQIDLVAQDEVLRDLGGPVRVGLAVTQHDLKRIASYRRSMILSPVAFLICSTVHGICSEKIASGPVCGATKPIFTVFVAAAAYLPKLTATAPTAAVCSIWRLLIFDAMYPSLEPGLRRAPDV